MAVKKFSHQTENLQTEVDASIEKKQGSRIFYKGDGLFSLQPIMEEKENPKTPNTSKKILDKNILILSFGDKRNEDFFPIISERTKRDLARHPELLNELLEHASGIASKLGKSLIVAPEISAAFFQPIINFVSSGKNVYPMTYEKAKMLHDVTGNITIKPIDLSLNKYFHYAYVSGSNKINPMMTNNFNAKHSNTIINDMYRNVLVPDFDNINVDYSDLKRFSGDSYFVIGGNSVSSISNNAYRTLFVINKDNELSVDLSKITLSNIPPQTRLSYYSSKSYYEELKDNHLKFPKMGEKNSSDFYINTEESPSNVEYENIKTDKIYVDKEDMLDFIRKGYKTHYTNDSMRYSSFLMMVERAVDKYNDINSRANKEPIEDTVVIDLDGEEFDIEHSFRDDIVERKTLKEIFLDLIRKDLKDKKRIYGDKFKSSDEDYINGHLDVLDKISSIVKLEREEGYDGLIHGIVNDKEAKDSILQVREAFENKKELNLEI